ncbi:MAG: FecR family protein [Desulfobulbaceae bacterium]|nr:FecR family protein [Desulfobulbaceae bacterium]HIJ91262.1 FecR domain-containing protein [Deltaproteobacteria bacterium]
MMKARKNSCVLQRFFRLGLIILALLPAFFPDLTTAEESAGKVDAVAGQVTGAGADGAIRTLTKDAPVFNGDIISTGPNSRVRIIFSDEGVIFLRPSTRFVIDSYKHTGNSQQDESKFSLVKGGFRSVTGAIGQANKEKVRIKTPVATIGIRGTDHEGRFCAGDCLDLTDIGVSAPPDGLYTATNVGKTIVGNQQFGPGQYGFTTPNRVTVRLPEPPPILVADPALRGALAPQQSTESKEKSDPASEKQGDQGEKPKQKQSGGKKKQPKKSDQPEQQEAGQGETPEQGAEEGFEIPAQPPATRAVQCQ